MVRRVICSIGLIAFILFYLVSCSYDVPVDYTYTECSIECWQDRQCGEACHEHKVYDWSSAPSYVKYSQTGWSSLLLPVAGVILLIGALFTPKEKKRGAESPPIESIHCPTCESDTILRTVKKGKDTGQQFHVCVHYPECKGRIKVR
jgi:ssDNA-binding Zn-finger/Zn-ribbon topoisomerase 1